MKVKLKKIVPPSGDTRLGISEKDTDLRHVNCDGHIVVTDKIHITSNQFIYVKCLKCQQEVEIDTSSMRDWERVCYGVKIYDIDTALIAPISKLVEVTERHQIYYKLVDLQGLDLIKAHGYEGEVVEWYEQFDLASVGGI